MLTELSRFFFEAVTSDPTIAALFPGRSEWMYFNMPPPETDFPYIAHTIIEGEYGEHSQINGEWLVSIYTGEVRTQLNQHISGLLKRKFNNTYWRTPYLPSIQISLGANNRFVDTDNNSIQRYEMTFNIRYSRSF